MTGFTDENKKKEDSYSSFIGTAGHYSVGVVSAIGILKEFNMADNYMLIQPSVVGYGNDFARVVKNRPTIISLTPGHPISMRPLEEGDLENYANHPPKSKIICP